MNQDYRRRMEEREIDLLDMIYYVFSHWRSILVAACIGLVVLGGFGAVKAAIENNKAKPTIDEMKEDMTEEYEKEDWTSKQIEDRFVYLDTVASQMKAFDDVIAAQQEYVDNFVMVRDNITNVYNRSMRFMVTVSADKQAYLPSIAQTYAAMIASDEVYSKAESALSGQIEKKYLPELISTSILSASSQGDSVISQDMYAAIFDVTVSGPSDEFVAKLGDAIAAAVNDKSASVGESVAEHTIAIVGDNSYTKYTNEYATKKSDTVGIIKARRDDTTKLKKDLSESEVSYVSAVNIAEDENADEKKASLISKKFIALGFIAGAAVLFCVWAAIYLLNGKVMCANGLESLSGVHAYSIKSTKDKNFIFDKWFRSWFDKNDYLTEDVVAQLIAIDVKKAEIEKLGIVCSKESAFTKSFSDMVKKELKDVSVVLCEDIVKNPKMKEELLSADGVVIVENVLDASVKNVFEELMESEGKKIIGCVGIK